MISRNNVHHYHHRETKEALISTSVSITLPMTTLSTANKNNDNDNNCVSIYDNDVFKMLLSNLLQRNQHKQHRKYRHRHRHRNMNMNTLCCKYDGISSRTTVIILFTLFWIVFLCFNYTQRLRYLFNLDSENILMITTMTSTINTKMDSYNPYGKIVAGRMNTNSMNINMNSNSSNNNKDVENKNASATATATASRTLGQKVIERSYYHSSGYYDFVHEFCPPIPIPLISNTNDKKNYFNANPSTIRQDFIINCLEKANVEGNKPQSKYHKKWPWWFRTLLRDTVQIQNGLSGPWHILQFTDVGASARDVGVGVGVSASSVANGVVVDSFSTITTNRNLTSSSSSSTNSSRTTSNNSDDNNNINNNNPRLQLCVYEKGGTKNWKRFHCAHNHNYTTTINEQMENKTIDFNHCYKKQPPYDDDNDNNYFVNDKHKYNNRKSDRVVFLRDPLTRFLSGFLDKCVRSRSDHCEPTILFSQSSTLPSTTTKKSGSNSSNSNNNNNIISPIDTMLWDNQRKFQAYVDTFPLKWNMHFFPQSFYCGGLYKSINEYDFIGSMGETFYTDLDQLQTKYPGLSKRGIDAIFHNNRNMNRNPTTHFKNKKDNNNIGIETGAAGKVLEYYTPHTVRRVLEYYAIDYIMLNLPIPKWAEEMLQVEEEEADTDADTEYT